MRPSNIFTDVEILAMNRRLKGEVADPTGAFARARRKLLEIETWNKPPLNKTLHSLLQQQRQTRAEEPAEPMKEQSFEEFRQEIGY